MNARGSYRRLRSRILIVPCCLLLALVALVALLVGPAGASTVTAPALALPLATSLQSSTGTWVTLPMGRLNQPLNTFWQLLFRPTGATTWSNEVGATATATNGGLVLASAAGQPLIAAIRPTNLLRFSPLIVTDNGGASWTTGLLSEGLASTPSSLSMAPSGRTLALVNRGLAARVLANRGTFSSWETITTARRLASVAGAQGCGLRALSAVASLVGGPMVGADCGRPGAVGIFVQRPGGWKLAAPTLSGKLKRDTVKVLSLEATLGGVTALLGLSGTAGTSLVAAWGTDQGSWSISRLLAVGSGVQLASVGPAGGSGLFVLTKNTAAATRLSVIEGPGSDWRQIPAPPKGTATLAVDGSTASTIEALAVHSETMTVWSLGSGSSNWTPGQVMHVSIKFGSSS